MDLPTDESAASADISVGSASAGLGHRKGIKLAHKRRETSAVLAQMKHQLRGMGLYEGTVDLSSVAPEAAVVTATSLQPEISALSNAGINASITSNIKEDDTTTIGDNVWRKPLTVMPPSPPSIHAMRVNASIDFMHAQMRKKAALAAASEDTTLIQEQQEIPASKNFSFSLTAEPVQPWTQPPDDDSTVTVSTRTGSFSSQHSLDLSHTGALDDLQPEIENDLTDEPHEPTNGRAPTEGIPRLQPPLHESTQEFDNSQVASVLQPAWDGDVTSQAAETAMARTAIKELKAEGESPPKPVSHSPYSAPSDCENFNPVIKDSSLVSLLPSQSALKRKLDAHATVLADLNRARDAALRSYSELIGLRNGLIDVSASFSGSSSQPHGLVNMQNVSHLYGASGHDESWTRPQDAQAALGITDQILTSFRQSFADLPKAVAKLNFNPLDDTIVDQKKDSGFTTVSSGSGDSSRVHVQEPNEPVLNGITGRNRGASQSTSGTLTGLTIGSSHDMSAGQINVDSLLESHSDMLIEKLMAKLAAAGAVKFN